MNFPRNPGIGTASLQGALRGICLVLGPKTVHEMA